MKKASDNYKITLELSHEEYVRVGWMIMDHPVKIILRKGSSV